MDSYFYKNILDRIYRIVRIFLFLVIFLKKITKLYPLSAEQHFRIYRIKSRYLQVFWKTLIKYRQVNFSPKAIEYDRFLPENGQTKS